MGGGYNRYVHQEGEGKDTLDTFCDRGGTRGKMGLERNGEAWRWSTKVAAKPTIKGASHTHTHRYPSEYFFQVPAPCS